MLNSLRMSTEMRKMGEKYDIEKEAKLISLVST